MSVNINAHAFVVNTKTLFNINFNVISKRITAAVVLNRFNDHNKFIFAIIQLSKTESWVENQMNFFMLTNSFWSDYRDVIDSVSTTN